MNPKSFKCLSCERLCASPNDDYVGELNCFNCTRTHFIINCEKCEQKYVVGDQDVKICVYGCICFNCNKSSLQLIDGKMRCTECISEKQIKSALKFKCKEKRVVETGSHSNYKVYSIDLNETITTNLCIDISRKIDDNSREILKCRKELSELRSMILDLINMVKYHPNLGGPEVKEMKTHFTENQ